MGLCGSSPALTEEQKEAKKASAKIEKMLAHSHDEDRMINKLLLLGAGESGKSTLFKQMQIIYGAGFSEREKRDYRNVVHSNVLTSMKALLEQGEVIQSRVGESTRPSASLQAQRDRILEAKAGEDLTPELAADVKALWADEGVQRAYAHRSWFQLTDSAAYFFEMVDAIAAPDYLPSDQDILRSRVRTTGIVESNFVIDQNKFSIFDVGGQRNERKKWIHCFQEVTAVLFVAALSEYDMVLFEDELTNRMDEAIQLFDEICNSPYFRQTSMILMLNKRDLFAEKIQNVPLTVWKPEYQGTNDYESAALYIRQQFEARKKDHRKVIYCHYTCATDSNLMRTVFYAVKDIIIRRSLEDGGLLH